MTGAKDGFPEAREYDAVCRRGRGMSQAADARHKSEVRETILLCKHVLPDRRRPLMMP